MSIEVEIKAWVDDFDNIFDQLNKNYQFINKYNKEDVYLKGINSITKREEEVRLRKVDGISIVTFKERKHIDKVEVNNEKEFTVDEPDNFLYIINSLGFTEYVTKSKIGFLFKKGSISIELSHVKNLGDFIEIEYLVESEGEVNGATRDIYTILDDLNISRNKIEDKYYVEMILNKKNGA